MTTVLKSVVRTILGKARTGAMRNFLTLAREYGQYRSMQENACVDRGGQAIPWYTYPLIEYLENIDLRGIRIFEYGSGNSSLYYLRRGAVVTSVEDDPDWHARIDGNRPDHRYLLAASPQEYVARPEIENSDIVVIDGSHRAQCAAYVIEKIHTGATDPALVIFDNSDWYPTTIARLDAGLGWHRVDFCGFGPINAFTWVSSVYLNPTRKPARIGEHIRSMRGIATNADT